MMYLPPCGHVECLAKCPCVATKDPVVDQQKLLAAFEQQSVRIAMLEAKLRAVADFIDKYAQEI